MGLEDCLDKTWPMTYVIIDEQRRKYLDRPYGWVGRKVLKTKLMESCLSQGVQFHDAKAWKVVHEEFSSIVQCSDGCDVKVCSLLLAGRRYGSLPMCSYGCDVKASLVVDASGFLSALLDYDARRGQQQRGYQIAHGILAEVEEHPFDLDKMLLMDWRDSHMGNEPYLRPANNKLPTFLYAMPLSHNLIFLEETSLVSRPVLSYAEIKKRMVARLRHLGIKCLEDEKCLIPMGGPLPIIPQSVVGAGGTAGLVHPSTGYLVARALATASVMADAIVECLGSIRMVRGSHLHRRVWSSLWPLQRKLEREFYCFGMETLLKLDLQGTRSCFDSFFDLDPNYWHGFLSSRLSLEELAMLSLSLFGHASNPSNLDIVSKCPIPLAKMMGKLALASI
ncbi:Capsanthin/capsorubin synthase, chromoplastic [Cinnamomum micranthum f. kanehirae]|uniref:Capsanthin/capsorubin synthase, chromoplastic n=1 Tax=Cinnamomum micranthum f. kanehirae TaxID=337451 RepID=A0A443P370_9MAGN|nr:Capsanthin/capsorubin synthase, chromoplastic [Cinnamomum micranthum f. kanehirae]